MTAKQSTPRIEREPLITRKGEVDGRWQKRQDHLDKLSTYLAKPRTVEACANHLGVGVRAIYLMFEELRGLGVEVGRVGGRSDGRYLLVTD